MTNEKPERHQNRERLISKDYILIMMACMGTAFCNYFFFTALPLYAIKISGSNVFGGMMVVTYSLAALAARPFAGIISDKFGRVKLLIIGALICAVACFLYGITTSIILILAIRVLNGLGFGIHSTCGGAVAADVIPKSRMAEGIGYFGLYATVASAFAPVIALSIVGNGEIRDFQFLFFLAAGLCLMSMIFDCFITYERRRKKEQQKITQTENPKEPLLNSAREESLQADVLPRTFLGFEYAVFLPVAVLILLFFAQSSINTFLTLFAAQRSLGNIGLFFTFIAVGLFLSRIFFGKLTDKRGPDIVVIPGIAGIVICMALIPFVKSPGFLFALGLPLGLANGAVYPSINSLIFKRCSTQRRGSASAAYFAAIDIGFMIGGTVFGFVADSFGYSVVYWASAVLTFIALLLYLKTVAEKENHEETEQLSIGDMNQLKEKTQKLWSRDFVIVMFACSGISFCNYFMTATLPIYAQNMTGTSVYAGLMLTAFTFAALLTRPITGVLSDKIGRVKLLILGASLCAVACILYHFSAVIVMLILVRALQGIGFGIHTTSGGAAAADIIPKSRMSEGLGIFGLYGTIASALAPAIALAIIGSGDNKNFQTLFTLASVIAVICIVLDALIRYERVKPDRALDKSVTPNIQCDDGPPLPKTYFGFEKGVLLPAAVMILIFIAFSSVTAFLPLVARERQLGDIGLFFTVNAAGMFCSRLFLGKVADKHGMDRVVLPALFVLLPCFALIPFINWRVYLFILAFPLGLAQGAICPAVNSMMFRRCSANRRGSASAAYFASIDLGFGAGALLFGFVAEHLGFDFIYWGAVVFIAAALTLYLLCLREKKQKAGVT